MSVFILMARGLAVVSLMNLVTERLRYNQAAIKWVRYSGIT